MPKHKLKGNPIIKQLREELAETNQLNGRLAQLLMSTANALKGEPDELTLHDWSDLPERARVLRQALENSRGYAEELRAQLEFATRPLEDATASAGHMVKMEGLDA
jgi:hypothetical protein